MGGEHGQVGHASKIQMENSQHTRAIQKVTSGELLTKQANEEKKYYIQKIHIYLSYLSM
jgi:hypothetical protein